MQLQQRLVDNCFLTDRGRQACFMHITYLPFILLRKPISRLSTVSFSEAAKAKSQQNTLDQSLVHWIENGTSTEVTVPIAAMYWKTQGKHPFSLEGDSIA